MSQSYKDIEKEVQQNHDAAHEIIKPAIHAIAEAAVRYRVSTSHIEEMLRDAFDKEARRLHGEKGDAYMQAWFYGEKT